MCAPMKMEFPHSLELCISSSPTNLKNSLSLLREVSDPLPILLLRFSGRDSTQKLSEIAKM